MILETERLILRPFELSDAPAVQKLAGAREVAVHTLHVPHPYPDGAAEHWIAKSADAEVRFAITPRESGELAGAIGMMLDRTHERAGMGYWIGVPFWGRGYATEAARAVLRHGFEALGINRIFAEHLTRNPASGRVLQKIGMRHEGTLRQHYMKWGEKVDVEMYAALRQDFVTR